MTSPTVLFVAVAVFVGYVTAASDTMNLVLLKDAYCLDSTHAGYYVRYGDPDLWVIWLEGGGACYTKESCRERAGTDLGSSKTWVPSTTPAQNILSSDPSKNPDFHTATMVYVPYCTGDVHAGQITEPSEASWGYRFSGHNNFVAITKNLTASSQGSPSLADGGHVLLTGGSAGGFGTFNNVDWLADYLGMEVKGAPTAGWFFSGDAAAPPQQASWMPPSEYPLWVEGKSGGLLADDTIVKLYDWYLNPACQAAHTADTAFQCASVHVAYPYLKSPLFVMQNQADTQQLGTEMQMPFKKNPSTLDYVSYFVYSMRNSTKQITTKPADAGFVASCYAHVSGLNVGGETTIDGITSGQMLGDWYFGRPMPKGRFLTDTCGGSPFPCNPTCPTNFPTGLDVDVDVVTVA